MFSAEQASSLLHNDRSLATHAHSPVVLHNDCFLFSAEQASSLIYDDSILATHAHTHIHLVVSHSHVIVLIHNNSFLFTAEQASSLFNDDISLAAIAHSHVHLVVSLVHTHSHADLVVSLVHTHSHVNLVVSLVHPHVVSVVVSDVHAHSHILVHHHASVYKLRSEVESAGRISKVEDFDPLLPTPWLREILQWQLTCTDDGRSHSIYVVNVNSYRFPAISYFDVHKLAMVSGMLATFDCDLGSPVLPLANMNMHDWIHRVEHAPSVMGKVSAN